MQSAHVMHLLKHSTSSSFSTPVHAKDFSGLPTLCRMRMQNSGMCFTKHGFISCLLSKHTHLSLLDALDLLLPLRSITGRRVSPSSLQIAAGCRLNMSLAGVLGLLESSYQLLPVLLPFVPAGGHGLRRKEQN